MELSILVVILASLLIHFFFSYKEITTLREERIQDDLIIKDLQDRLKINGLDYSIG